MYAYTICSELEDMKRQVAIFSNFVNWFIENRYTKRYWGRWQLLKWRINNLKKEFEQRDFFAKGGADNYWQPYQIKKVMNGYVSELLQLALAIKWLNDRYKDIYQRKMGHTIEGWIKYYKKEK